MDRHERSFVAVVVSVCSLVIPALLMHKGMYGWTLFCASPLVIGGSAAWVVQPRSGWRAARVGALAAMIPTVLLLFLGVEGLICIVMALPLVVPLGALGGWLAYRVERAMNDSRSITALLLIPLATFGFDMKAKPPVYSVTTQIEIQATPQQVWKHAAEFSPMSEPKEWYFHTGIAYPQGTRLERPGVGAARYCDLSTGPVVERVVTWDPPRTLTFDVISTPDAMREWSPFGDIHPKHLHGYYISKRGAFKLIPQPDGSTLLQGTSWYQHGLWPAEYWRCWSDAIIHRIHMRVLVHVRELAEADARANR